MNTWQMEYIVKIAETGSITKAADELYITQSALDQQLLKLEKELGAKLFARSRQRLTPTEAGRVYVEYARRMLELKKEAYAIISDIAQGVAGTLSIGLTPERGIDMFMNVYPQFYELYPAVNVIPQEIRVRRQQEMLREGELDIGFVTMSKDEPRDAALKYERIYSERFVLAVPKDHPVAAAARDEGLTRIPAARLKESLFAVMFDGSTQRTALAPLFDAAGFIPNIILKTASNRTLARMVEHGICSSIFPEYYMRPHENVAFFEPDADVSWEVSTCYARDRYMTRAAREFIRMAAAFWREGAAAKRQ